jgi:hypothetical protein
MEAQSIDQHGVTGIESSDPVRFCPSPAIKKKQNSHFLLASDSIGSEFSYL